MTYRKKGPEYHPAVKIASAISIAGMVLSSCRSIEAGNNHIPSPSATEPRATEFIPNPTGTPVVLEGAAVNNEEIEGTFGRTVAAGGMSEIVGDIKVVVNSTEIKDKLHSLGLGQITERDEDGRELVAKYTNHESGERVCFPVLPTSLYNPDLPDETEAELFTSQFVRSYGIEGPFPDQIEDDEVISKAIGAVKLRDLPEEIVCVSAYVADEDSSFGSWGTLLNVLMDTSGNFYGSFPAAYPPDADIDIDFSSGTVMVDGEEVWFMGDRAGELVSQIAPTVEPTSIPELTDVLNPIDMYRVGDNAGLEKLSGGNWENVVLPDGVDELSFIEEHEGDYYLIDIHDKAVGVLNEEGEWERYTRPAILVYDKEWISENDIPQEVYEEIDDERIVRLKNPPGVEDEIFLNLQDTPDNLVPFGYIGEWRPYADDPDHPKHDLAHVYVSGYVRGVVKSLAYFVFFEVPSRYERQIISIVVPDQTDSFLNFEKIPVSGNIDESRRISESWKTLGEATRKQNAVGRQAIFGFEIPPWGRENQSSQFDLKDQYAEYFADDIRNNVFNMYSNVPLTTSFAWYPEDLLK